MSTEPLATQTEFGFSLDEFSRVKTTTGLHALALKLQNMLLTEPNTYPNSSDFGVGIGLYLFEKANDETFSEIKTRINEQLSKYLPDAPIQEIVIDTAKNVKITNKEGDGLLLGFALSEKVDGEELIGYAFFNDSQRNVKSEILIT